jgi:phosphoadenosine phosphosulfate reductase
MASPKVKALQRKMYPGVERQIKKSIQWLIDNKGYMNNHNATVDEVFDWWCSNQGAAQYFGMLRNQMKMF